MRERHHVIGRTAERATRSRRRVLAAVAVAALTAAGIAVATPASATDSYAPTRIAAGSNPGVIAFTPNGGRAIVTNAPRDAQSTFTSYNTVTHARSQSIGMLGGGANGLAISPDGEEAYGARMNDGTGDSGLTVVDLVTNRVAATLNAGEVWDVAYTRDGSKVYAVVPQFGSAKGYIRVYEAATRVNTTTISLGENPYDVAMSPDGSRAYVTNGGDGSSVGTVSVIDVASDKVTATIPVGVSPGGVAVTPDGASVFVANFGNGRSAGNVSVISTATNTVTATIANVGVGAFDLKITPNGSQAWVLNSYAGTVAVIDVASKKKVHTFTVGGQPWSLAFTPDGTQAWVAIDGTDVNITGTIAIFDLKSANWAPSVSRVSGTDRYATSVAVSKKAFPATAPVVFVATGADFPDALAAAAPAAKLGGPLLLTDPRSLPSAVKAEIKRLQPSTIYVVGATGAVSATVQQQLTALAPTVTRLAGTDRYSTARAAIAVAFPTISKVYIATGANFPDALSASAAGGGVAPVLLVNGAGTSIDSATSSFLTSRGANSFTVVGGPTVVSNGISTQLAKIGATKRVYGANRTATSQLINAAAFPTITSAYFATGTQFADALSGAVLAAVNHAPLYVVSPTCVPTGSEHDLATRGTTAVTLIGGTGALSDAVAKLHNC